MADIGPEQILKFDFTPGIDIGFLPQQAEWGTVSLMKMGFLPKQGTSILPYSLGALSVVGESPAEPAPSEAEEKLPTPTVPAPTTTTAPVTTTAPTTTTSTPPTTTPTTTTGTTATPVVSGVVRPHNALISLVSRISARQFLKTGITFRLYIDAPGEISAYVASRYKTGPGKAKEHVISKKASKALAEGFYEISLMPDATGKLALKRFKSLEAKVIMSFLYEDKTSAKLEHGFEIGPA